MHEGFYGKYFAHAQPGLSSGEGFWKEAKCPAVESVSSDRQSCVRSMQAPELPRILYSLGTRGTEKPVTFTE